MIAPVRVSILSVLLFSNCALAQSQRPPDSQIGDKPRNNQQPTINVTLAPAQKNAEELAAEAKKRQEDLALATKQLEINAAQLAFNRRLFFVTGAQVLIGVLGLGISWLALSVSVAAKRNMDRQTEHMQGQLIATQQSAQAASDAVVMTHRPKLIVRDIDTPLAEALFKAWQKHEDGTLNQAISAAAFAEGEVDRLRGSIRLMNKGETIAVVESFDCQTLIVDRLPLKNPAFDNAGTISEPEMGAGVSRRVQIPQRNIEMAERIELVRRTKYLYLVGVIVYKDRLGNARRTGFARKLEVTTGRFSSQPDPDYEYQD